MAEGAAGQFKIEPPKKRPLRGLTPDETKDAITHFVCLIDYPWSIIDYKAFMDLWQIEIDPPSAKVIKSWTIKMHQWMKENIAKVFTSVHHVAHTTNTWIGKNRCGLLGVMMHLIDATWEYHECTSRARGEA